MLAIQYLLYGLAVAAIVAAAAILLFDVYLMTEYRRRLTLAYDEPLPIPRPIRWKPALQLAGAAVVVALMASSIAVVPSGMAGVRVSQISGTLPGTLYPGVHFVKPLIESVAMYDVRDQLYTTSADISRKTDKSADKEKPAASDHAKAEPFVVQAKEGLPIGLAVTVRYKLDARRLDFIHNTLPEPIEAEVVPPVIGSVFRGIVPQYTVRDVFSTQREHIREVAAQQITQKLASDGIVVKEVILREVQLPPEYAKGLENLLLKEQENDQLAVQTEIQQKQVRIFELQAEGERVQEVKRAEGAAQVRVLQAKGESDAMQYTLPLKEKQIQQSKLEAEARKESTIKNAEAAAEAKVIDSKAELQRRNLLTDAEANRIRITAAADAERMRSEAAVLKQTPLLINKIIAERLSDKLQIMMVPADGKYFFASDVLRGQMPQQMSENDPPGESTQNSARTPDPADEPNAPRIARRNPR
jgi:regulator of protease activity HflC (stomatin/prohibitin superfamily)